MNRLPVTRSFRPRRLVPLAGITLLAAACADDKPLNTFEDRGPRAESLNELMYPVIWGIMGLVFVVVIGGTLWLTVKNRVKPEDYDPNDLPKQIHGHFAAEISWTIAPAVLLAVVGVFTIMGVWELESKNDPENGLDVMVIGQQWWWEYR